MAKFPAKSPAGQRTFEQWGAIFFFVALFAIGPWHSSFADEPASYLGAQACAAGPHSGVRGVERHDRARRQA